jgi:hypothetical protein
MNEIGMISVRTTTPKRATNHRAGTRKSIPGPNARANSLEKVFSPEAAARRREQPSSVRM